MNMKQVLTSALLATVLGGCATTLAPAPRGMSAPEIVALAKSGTPPDQIIVKLRDTRVVHTFSAAELAQMGKDGVPDAVLNHLQAEHLAAVRHDSRMFYPVYGAWGPRVCYSPRFRHGFGWACF